MDAQKSMIYKDGGIKNSWGKENLTWRFTNFKRSRIDKIGEILSVMLSAVPLIVTIG